MTDFERPTLPGGYFYRVDLFVIPVVQVRRKRRFGSEEIASCLIEGHDTPENLTRAACGAFDAAFVRIEWARTMQALRVYEGDYR